MKLTTFEPARPVRSPSPCRENSPKADPWPFDLTKIDTCEEAMFAPGADMIVKALVGEEQAVKVSFRCEGQQMDYVQDAQGIRGTINGTEFLIDRQVEGEVARYRGDTPAGVMDYTSTRTGEKLNIKGLAGTVQYSHDLFPGDAAQGMHSEMQGKFG
jgi:hypothetical protein